MNYNIAFFQDLPISTKFKKLASLKSVCDIRNVNTIALRITGIERIVQL